MSLATAGSAFPALSLPGGARAAQEFMPPPALALQALALPPRWEPVPTSLLHLGLVLRFFVSSLGLLCVSILTVNLYIVIIMIIIIFPPQPHSQPTSNPPVFLNVRVCIKFLSGKKETRMFNVELLPPPSEENLFIKRMIAVF